MHRLFLCIWEEDDAECGHVPILERGKPVVLMAVTAAESVESLRNWASGRCLSASVSELYQRGGTTTNTTDTV